MKGLLLTFFILSGLTVWAQLPSSPDSMYLLALNVRIDNLVVQQQVDKLDSLYADDFVFSHGSGRIEGKAGWLKTVGRTRYQNRKHDSVRVQQHGDVAVLRGKMYIVRLDKTKSAKYNLHYVRVFALRSGRWQLLSHTTVEETQL
jgi:hypothetical protein